MKHYLVKDKRSNEKRGGGVGNIQRDLLEFRLSTRHKTWRKAFPECHSGVDYGETCGEVGLSQPHTGRIEKTEVRYKVLENYRY